MNKQFEMPKFKIGDYVYSASSHWLGTKQQCPDCLGQKTWEVTTPAGEKFPLECRTCWQGYNGNSGTISSWDYEPVVRSLTIGSVRIDTTDEKPIAYMCEETGIGSGAIHYQENLFGTEDEAKQKAEELVVQARMLKRAEFLNLQKHKKKDVPHKPYIENKIAELKKEIKQLEKRGY